MADVRSIALGDNTVHLVRRGSARLLVDTGPDFAGAWEALREGLGGEPPDVVMATHYEFLAPAITAEFPGVSVLGTGEPVARRACALLAELDLEAPPDAEGALDLIVSGNRDAFLQTLPKLGFAPREAAEAES